MFLPIPRACSWYKSVLVVIADSSQVEGPRHKTTQANSQVTSAAAWGSARWWPSTRDSRATQPLVLEALWPPQRDGDARRLASLALHTLCQAALRRQRSSAAWAACGVLDTSYFGALYASTGCATAVHVMVPGGLYGALASSMSSNSDSSCSSSGRDGLECSRVAPEATAAYHGACARTWWLASRLLMLLPRARWHSCGTPPPPPRPPRLPTRSTSWRKPLEVRVGLGAAAAVLAWGRVPVYQTCSVIAARASTTQHLFS